MTSVSIPGAMPSEWPLQPLTPADVPGLLAIQRVCYGPDFQESAPVFARRLACTHHCSLGLHTPQGLQAYLAAYWSHSGKVTPLDGDFAPLGVGPQVLYLHDMAVLPALAGQGVARALWQQAQHLARQRGVQQAALVSVQDSQAYWQRQGFVVQPVVDAQQQRHLATYGPHAVYMVAAL